MITAQEIIVGNAGYPTELIGRTQTSIRALGLGYANLGALLMSLRPPLRLRRRPRLRRRRHGPHDRQRLRHLRPYSPRAWGPSPSTRGTASRCWRVIEKHRQALDRIDAALVPEAAARGCPRRLGRGALAWARRTAIATPRRRVLAPTGTIAFMMDCDTTGVEPDIALVSYKRLVGGGMIKMVNRTVPLALRTLGYSRDAGRRDRSLCRPGRASSRGRRI